MPFWKACFGHSKICQIRAWAIVSGDFDAAKKYFEAVGLRKPGRFLDTGH